MKKKNHPKQLEFDFHIDLSTDNQMTDFLVEKKNNVIFLNDYKNKSNELSELDIRNRINDLLARYN